MVVFALPLTVRPARVATVTFTVQGVVAATVGTVQLEVCAAELLFGEKLPPHVADQVYVSRPSPV